MLNKKDATTAIQQSDNTIYLLTCVLTTHYESDDITESIFWALDKFTNIEEAKTEAEKHLETLAHDSAATRFEESEQEAYWEAVNDYLKLKKFRSVDRDDFTNTKQRLLLTNEFEADAEFFEKADYYLVKIN